MNGRPTNGQKKKVSAYTKLPRVLDMILERISEETGTSKSFVICYCLMRYFRLDLFGSDIDSVVSDARDVVIRQLRERKVR